MSGEQVLWIGIGLVVLLLLLFFNQRLAAFARFIIRGMAGAAAIFGVNMFAGSVGLNLLVGVVGVNIFTVVVSALLGLPGVVMLYGLGLMG